MPEIYDNIESSLLPALCHTLSTSRRVDCCVGYFNLRGWQAVAGAVAGLPGDEGLPACRVLIGMQRLPDDEYREFKAIRSLQDEAPDVMDQGTAARQKRQAAARFRAQLAYGAPSDADEASLRDLARQLESGQVQVRLFLRHPLHAKLYLAHRDDHAAPRVAYLGSSNLTMAGLAAQGELNVEVIDGDATAKLAGWFEDRWADRWCLDISQELLDLIHESWASEALRSPWHIYLKMIWHLCREAREEPSDFRLPPALAQRLFDFQLAAVKLAARHVDRRGGVLIGDVVGLGKTLMATALARYFQDRDNQAALIISPPNLCRMWETYRTDYELGGQVLSLGKVIAELPNLRRYPLVIIDESHNLRNPDGQRYRAILEYLRRNESRVILLSATPYNAYWQDLSSQLQLFLPEDQDLGIRPEALLRETGEQGFAQRFQCDPRTLAAFERSEHSSDWQELMRRYLVRRTRGFIERHYAEVDEAGRRYLPLADGSRNYFPRRRPKTVVFEPSGQYQQLYSDPVVDAINQLELPRYGLGNYLADARRSQPTRAQQEILNGLTRAGKRLMGFCRTNLFKRLESSGDAFLQSVERHVLRNAIFLHALDHGLDLPIGTQDAGLLDPALSDADPLDLFDADADDAEAATPDDVAAAPAGRTLDDFLARGGDIYRDYAARWKTRFKWLPARFFTPTLRHHLAADARILLGVLNAAGPWEPATDGKLAALEQLLRGDFAGQKVLVFSQFADTVHYLAAQLAARGLAQVAGVTGQSGDPTRLAARFSPRSNAAKVSPEDELQVLIATDVLSEGQNLQDCAVVVNYDLPWAIIKLIQRAGRVDRLGQQAAEIHCLSFLPADGVEQVISLRDRVRRRLQANGEVIGSDEQFLDEQAADNEAVRHLYHEQAEAVDDLDDPDDVDLSSWAWQIWDSAVRADPSLATIIPNLPDVVHATMAWPADAPLREGVVTFTRSTSETESFLWLDAQQRLLSQSPVEILNALRCTAETPGEPRRRDHHTLVDHAARLAVNPRHQVGGSLGPARRPRHKVYQRLKHWLETLDAAGHPDQEAVGLALDALYAAPLQSLATSRLDGLLRAGGDDDALARLVAELHRDAALVIRHGDDDAEPRILCSLGLAGPDTPRAEADPAAAAATGDAV